MATSLNNGSAQGVSNITNITNVTRYPYAGAYVDTSNLSIPGYVPLEVSRNKSSSSSRTNYVTTDGYVPNFNTPIPEPPLNLIPPYESEREKKARESNRAQDGKGFGLDNVDFLNKNNFAQGLARGMSQESHQGGNVLNNPNFAQGLAQRMSQESSQEQGSFMNNPNVLQALARGFSQEQERQSAQQGPSLLNNQEFVNSIYTGYQNAGNRESINRADSRDSQPRETRITDRQSFSSNNDNYGY